MTLRLYLDTSVFSALFDDADPVRQRETQELFRRLGGYEASTSAIGRAELLQTPDQGLRAKLVELLGRVRVIEVTAEARELADSYLQAGNAQRRPACCRGGSLQAGRAAFLELPPPGKPSAASPDRGGQHAPRPAAP